MYIIINCLGMPFNGGTISKGDSLGGSETAAYYMAKELVKLGNVVTVFTTNKERGKFDGVNYEWCGEMTQQTPLGHIYHAVSQSPVDVCIVQRHPAAFMYQPNSKLNIWWLHDLALYRNMSHVQKQVPFIDQIFTVSKFHADQVAKVYDIPKEFIYNTTNGVDYGLIPNWVGNIEREDKSLLFASRPERGLEALVMPGGIMEKLPGYKLYVCGYDNTTQKMANYYNILWNRCQQLPNVVNMGSLSKYNLYKKMCETSAYVYPTLFEDTSCILAMEAQACGLPWISCNTGALGETLKNGGYIFSKQSNKDKNVNIDNFVKTIKTTFKGNLINELREKTKAVHFAWSSIAKQWNDLFLRLLKSKSQKSKPRLIKHFEHYSDIVAIQKMNAMKDFKNASYYDFAFSKDPEAAKKHYDKYYEYEKNRGVNYGPESLDNNKRFEFTYNLLKERKFNSLLDYGCAHGHYTINLAKRFKDKNINFYGADLAQSNIDIAAKWALDDKIDNIKFFNINEPAWEGRKYDVILIEEVLEHVVDPRSLIIRLKDLLTENGIIVMSTPYGAWEAIGYEQHKGWRAHLHHFERSDLEDMFKNQKGYKLYAIPHNNRLGHYVVTIDNNKDIPGEIDYTRKANTQAPKETISLCVIAKDEEDTLAKQCKQIRSYVDEIVIGVDETSKDSTLEVAKKYGDVIIEIKTPAGPNGIGFDMARNQTIKKASCDWILWLDCDESLENPGYLDIYCRNNCINGYFIAQHHYSAEPPTIIKTDYPVRLFRNNKDIKFWGFVHEHPEQAINKGPGKVAFASGLHVMHTGYSTETIRRNRFKRNFPMMQKEIKINPNRYLSKFLYLRDLGNLINYSLERNGNTRTEQGVEYCNIIIQKWNELLKARRLRMVIDGLSYYSMAVNYLGGRAINFKCNITTSPAGGNPLNLTPIDGTFESRATIDKLLNLMLDENLNYYDEKYF